MLLSIGIFPVGTSAFDIKYLKGSAAVPAPNLTIVFIGYIVLSLYVVAFTISVAALTIRGSSSIVKNKLVSDLVTAVTFILIAPKVPPKSSASKLTLSPGL